MTHLYSWGIACKILFKNKLLPWTCGGKNGATIVDWRLKNEMSEKAFRVLEQLWIATSTIATKMSSRLRFSRDWEGGRENDEIVRWFVADEVWQHLWPSTTFFLLRNVLREWDQCVREWMMWWGVSDVGGMVNCWSSEGMAHKRRRHSSMCVHFSDPCTARREILCEGVWI